MFTVKTENSVCIKVVTIEEVVISKGSYHGNQKPH